MGLKRPLLFSTSLPIKHHCSYRPNAFVYSVRRLAQFYHFFSFAVSGLGRRGEIIQEMKPQQSALYNYRGPTFFFIVNNLDIYTFYSNIVT